MLAAETMVTRVLQRRRILTLNIDLQVLHQTSNKLDKALTTNKEVTEDNEERLQKVSEEVRQK